METEEYEILRVLLDELKREQSELSKQFREKKNGIAEIDAYLRGFLDKDANDLQVFLPRKVEDIYHDRIEQNNRERDRLQSECDELDRQYHITSNRIKQLEKVISDSSMLHVKQLSILDVQEKERQRIARDLHDTSLQNLTHLVHKVELGALYIDEDHVKAKLELATVEKGIREVIEDIRNSIFDLRPMSVDDLGLKDTIEKLAAVLNQENKFRIVMDIDDIPASDSGETSFRILQISIYRIIQECLHNSMKHSGGKKIDIRLKDNGDRYFLTVKDDGTGFDVADALKKEKHFGLSVMKERVLFLGGTFHIDTTAGTSVEIEIPKRFSDEPIGF